MVLWARPSAMTRIPGKRFSPQCPKLLAGPLNLYKVTIHLNCLNYLSNFLQAVKVLTWYFEI